MNLYRIAYCFVPTKNGTKIFAGVLNCNASLILVAFYYSDLCWFNNIALK